MHCTTHARARAHEHSGHPIQQMTSASVLGAPGRRTYQRMRKMRSVRPCVTSTRLVSAKRPMNMSRVRWSSKMVNRSYTSAPDSPLGNLRHGEAPLSAESTRGVASALGREGRCRCACGVQTTGRVHVRAHRSISCPVLTLHTVTLTQAKRSTRPASLWHMRTHV